MRLDTKFNIDEWVLVEGRIKKIQKAEISHQGEIRYDFEAYLPASEDSMAKLTDEIVKNLISEKMSEVVKYANDLFDKQQHNKKLGENDAA